MKLENCVEKIKGGGPLYIFCLGADGTKIDKPDLKGNVYVIVCN
jgi:hypothetical protein